MTPSYYFRWAERAGERLLEIWVGVIGFRNQLTIGARVLRGLVEVSLVPSAGEAHCTAGVATVTSPDNRRQSRTKE